MSIWDRAIVINVREQEQRLMQFYYDLSQSKLLSTAHVEPWYARTPNDLRLPEWYRPSPWATEEKVARGHWACRRSHMQILEEALCQGVEHLLVLEDDTFPRESFDIDFELMFRDLPPDWLGYKLMAQAPFDKPQTRRQQISGNCWQMGGGGGTQAIGYSKEGMKKALDWLWKDINDLVDTSLVKLMSKTDGWYRPNQWIIGERAGISSITGVQCCHDPVK